MSVRAELPPTWTPATLEAELRRNGPFAYLAQVPEGRHIFVVTGAEDSFMFVNNPADGCTRWQPYEWLERGTLLVRRSATSTGQGMPVLYLATGSPVRAVHRDSAQ